MTAVWAAVLGAAGGVDRTAFGQTLLSHPGVLAALAGWVVGAPREGAWLGVALTLLATPQVPVGRERLRDWPSAAVGACCAVGSRSDAWAWGAALALAIALAPVAGWAIDAVRWLVSRITEGLRRQLEQGDCPPARLERWHVACGALELVRGAAVALLATGAIAAALAAVEPVLAGPERAALSAFWTLAPLAGLPLALRLRAADVPRRWWWPAVLAGAVAVGLSGGGPP